MIKEKSILYLYIMLWFFYELQGLFWSVGNLLSQFIVLSLTFLSFVYVGKVHMIKHLPIFIIALDVLLFMFTIYGIIYAMGDVQIAKDCAIDKPINYLKNIYNSLLPIYFFYYFSRKKMMTEEDLVKFVFFFFFMSVLSFVNCELLSSVMIDEKGGYVNNKSYAFLSLFPLIVFLYKRPVIQYVLLTGSLFFVLLGMKRGAVLIAFVCLPVFFIDRMRNSSSGMKLAMSFLSLSVILGLCFFVSYLVNTNEFFLIRVKQTLEGESSGRDIIYSSLWSYFIDNTTDFQFLFGSGANATLSRTENFAHNDWLEICINQGVLGVSLYLFYWVAFISELKSLKGTGHVYIAYLLLVVIFFMKTIFSMSYSDMNIYATCVLGYCLNYKRQNNEEKENITCD